MINPRKRDTGAGRLKRALWAVLPAAALLWTTALKAEVAVVPYRVENPSAEFGPGLGAEYGKILGVLISLRKGLEVSSPRDVENDLKGFSLSPGEPVTGEKLSLMGKARYLDLIVVGTLAKTGRAYRAESRLYSVKEGRVVAKSRAEAGSLFECARRDMEELFFSYPSRREAFSDGGAVEALVLLDSSYNMAPEWDAVTRGIRHLADGLSASWEAPLKVHLVPFSSRQDRLRKHTAVSSAGLSQALAGLRPLGACGGKDLDRAMDFAVRQVPWGKNNRRLIVLIVNSPVAGARSAERLALSAAKKGIEVHVLSMGKQGPDERNLLRQTAVVGKGFYREVAYRQKVFDLRGAATDLYMEGGRFFHGRDAHDRWKEGLYHGSGRNVSRRQKPREFLAEIHYDEGRYAVTPYTMASRYPEVADRQIINSGALENNADTVLSGLGRRFTPGGAAGKGAGRVLLSDGKVSLWVRVRRADDMAFFKNKQALGRVFPLGVSVVSRPGEPYGITFNPGYFVTKFGQDYIPESASATIEEMIKNPGRYMEDGISRPPLWFLRVKVEETRSAEGAVDIRDEP